MFSKIYTHSGMFHADDVLAVAAALILAPKAAVIKVRELPETFNPERDLALDVGGQYVPGQNMFDHHQKDGNTDGMAAVGKFWTCMGQDVVRKSHPNLHGKQLEEVCHRVAVALISPVDRADIGLLDWQVTNEAEENDWQHLSASKLVSMANLPFGSSPEDQHEAFMTCVGMMNLAIRGQINQSVEYARMAAEVDAAVANATPDQQYLVINNPGPWQGHVLERESLQHILYVLFPSDRGGWMIQCVPDANEGFGKRKELPITWAGLRDQEFAGLTELAQSGSATFCHPGRFIAGAETFDDVCQLAQLASNA